MFLYPLVPLAASLLCAALASALFFRHGRERAPRLAALVVSAVGFWALCEAVLNVQTDAARALFCLRLSALGWVWLGPLALHLFLELSPRPGARRILPLAYACSALMLAVAWLTPWVHSRVIRTGWGWSYEFGPAYPFVHTFLILCIGAGGWLAWRGLRQQISQGERGQARAVAAGILAPMLLGSLTDGFLPLMGIHVPRVGAASFSALGLVVLWSFHRYGYSLLAPGDFASEILETLPDGVALARVDGRIRRGNSALGRLLEAELPALVGLRLEERLCRDVRAGAARSEQRCDLLTLRGRRRPVAVSSELLRDRQGSPIGRVWVVRDLEEVVALRDRLLLSGRLAAVGELAAGIAHEIANPLAYVRANLGLMRQHWDALGSALEKAGARREQASLLGEGEEILDETLEGVDRAVAIVRDVRGLAHGGRGERRPADVVRLLEGVLRLAAPQLREGARVLRDFESVPLVWCAPQELQQVFLNLVLNAVQAMEGEGSIRIATRGAGGDVVVEVQDDGVGIPPEIRDRIFDPFFTTKGVGEGSGLGLGIAHGIVRSHGGEIRVESELGRGSCFSVHLPAVADTLDAT